EVGPMGGEDVLSSCEPAKEGRARVGDEGPDAGDSSREETRIIDGLRSARRGISGGERVRRSEDRKRREEESEERASDVPEEDAGRMPVVNEESEARSSRDETHARDPRIADRRTKPEPCRARDDGLRTGDPVDPVHEVVGVRESDDPDEGERITEKT